MTEHRTQPGKDREPHRSRRAPTADQAAAEASLEAYIERIVSAAPPFTATQRARLAAILGSAAPAVERVDRDAADREDGRS